MYISSPPPCVPEKKIPTSLLSRHQISTSDGLTKLIRR